MGDFRYIVKGRKRDCLAFYQSDTHCYDRQIDREFGSDDEYCLWFSGNRKFRPDLMEIQKQSKSLQVEVRGSYENEDRDEWEELGEYIHYVNGKLGKENFDEEERDYLDIAYYD